MQSNTKIKTNGSNDSKMIPSRPNCNMTEASEFDFFFENSEIWSRILSSLDWPSIILNCRNLVLTVLIGIMRLKVLWVLYILVIEHVTFYVQCELIKIRGPDRKWTVSRRPLVYTWIRWVNISCYMLRSSDPRDISRSKSNIRSRSNYLGQNKWDGCL